MSIGKLPPLVDLEPPQACVPPVAVQEEAFPETVQVNLEVTGEVPVVGLAVRVTEGAAGTVTFTVICCGALPPGPVQVME